MRVFLRVEFVPEKILELSGKPRIVKQRKKHTVSKKSFESALEQVARIGEPSGSGPGSAPPIAYKGKRKATEALMLEFENELKVAY